MRWILNPIESFFRSEDRELGSLLVPEGANETPFEDETLWKAGKRAFDIIHDRCGSEAETKEGLEEIILGNAEELTKLYNGVTGGLNSYVAQGWFRLIDEETGQPHDKLAPLKIDIKKFDALYEIESSVWMLDDIFEALALRGGETDFPYDREFVAAMFTLAHVNDSALSHVFLGCHQPDAHSWAVRWFEKLDNFDRTIRSIDANQKRNHKEKSQMMNQARHAKRNEAVALVTTDWNKRKADFRSAEKAGNFYADWLRERGFEYEPRTVTGWIRKFAKENSIRLR